jgi:hypothetical protein
MKIDGLRVGLKEGGVTAFVRARAEVPLRRLARMPVAALEAVRLDSAALGAPEDVSESSNHLDLTPLHLRGMPAIHQGRAGIVVAQTVAQGMEFLLERWEPCGEGEPDATIRELQTRRAARHVRVKELEELLLRREDDDDPFTGRRPRRRHRRPQFVWAREAFEQFFEQVPARPHALYLPGRMRSFPNEDLARPAAVVERCRIVGTHRVPQWDVLIPRETDDGQIVARGFTDGRWFQEPFSRLDPRILEGFDEAGRLVAIADGDPLVGEALDACFVVRVPRRAAPRDARTSGGVQGIAAQFPGVFLVDSRSPVVLRPDLPVIDDAAEAWAVLLRTTSGVFMPDAAPTALPKAFRALAGQYVVACVPPAIPSARQP